MTEMVSTKPNKALRTRPTAEQKQLAAEMLGWCVDSGDIIKHFGITRQTLWDWQNQEEFQLAVSEANRQYIAEFRAGKSRILKLALEVVEQEMKKADSKTRLEMAYGIVRSVL